MQELLVDFIISLNGYAAAEGPRVRSSLSLRSNTKQLHSVVVHSECVVELTVDGPVLEELTESLQELADIGVCAR